MRKTIIAFLVLFCLASNAVVPALSQSRDDVYAKIRKEGMDNSQIMRTLHYFTDVYGPRLTGSPNHKAAADWAVAEMTKWGFENAGLEPWDFGHPGWVNERASGFITSPVQDSLVFEVLAWTPGTKKGKPVSGPAFLLRLPMRPNPNNPNFMTPPTQDELNKFFAEIKDQIKGKMVLVGKPAVIPVAINPPPKRLDDATLNQRLSGGGGPGGPPQNFQPPQPVPGQLTNQQLAEQLDAFLVANKAAVRVNDAGREHGQIRAFNNRSFDVSKTVPTVVMRNEDYGRIWRLAEGGATVNLEFAIQNRIIPEGTTSYNTVAEITGSDKKDEVIMLGGHLDSWHAATGATDNAIGCAIMMEAARILKTIGVKPRRTIRVALWSGEEQGLLGSQAYVKKHFGSFESPLSGFEKFGGYFNIDSGTGRARAMGVFGPPEAAAILKEALAPFSDYGFAGVMSSKSRALGGSDNTSFNQAGLPGIGVMQDPIEYGTHTWHTNLDTYERIIEDDVKKAAIVIAAGVYALAMRDDLMPRFKAEDMPKPPPTPTPTPAPSPAKKP